MSGFDLDSPEHAPCSEALRRADDDKSVLRGEVARLKKLIEGGQAAHNEERVARDWLAREKNRLEVRVAELEAELSRETKSYQAGGSGLEPEPQPVSPEASPE